MPFVTIRRLSFEKVNHNDLPNGAGAPPCIVIQTMRADLKEALQKALSAIPELEITPDKVMVSIPVEQERNGDWWQNPTVEIIFADAELRTPQVKREALDTACRAVWDNFPKGYLQSVRGCYSTIDPTTQYAKVTAENIDPYAEIKALIGDLVKACNSWALLADDDDEQPMLGDSPIELEMSAAGILHITHHIPGQQHIYVNVRSNGDISVTLSLPTEGDSHELLLHKDCEPLYSHDASQISIGFPVVRFISWLQLAINACTTP